jgi:hypothetical protein
MHQMNIHSIYITKWVDLSKKYGFGYKLSNEWYGVLFNDNTTLLNYKDGLIYIWKEDEIEMRAEYQFEDHPKDVKLKCLLYVKNYLEKVDDEEPILLPWKSKFEHLNLATSQWIDKQYQRTSISHPKTWISSWDAVYLQRWKLNKKWILFRISNQVFQSNFLDGSQIFVCSSSPIAWFKSSDGEIVVKNMSTEKMLKLSHPSFYKRIQYVRNLLVQIINKHNDLYELDENFEEEEYLNNHYPSMKSTTDERDLATQGREAKLEKENMFQPPPLQVKTVLKSVLESSPNQSNLNFR